MRHKAAQRKPAKRPLIHSLSVGVFWIIVSGRDGLFRKVKQEVLNTILRMKEKKGLRNLELKFERGILVLLLPEFELYEPKVQPKIGRYS